MVGEELVRPVAKAVVGGWASAIWKRKNKKREGSSMGKVQFDLYGVALAEVVGEKETRRGRNFSRLRCR